MTAYLEELLGRIGGLADRASSIFTLLDAAGARAQAMEKIASRGRAASGIAGWCISIKDNIDLAGFTTTAGSAAFENEPPASRDAAVVKRLKGAGAVLFGKTNMTEHAYSAVGLNRRFGTPLNPAGNDGTQRLCGGSSTGAAAALALGLGHASIGTDTGGSVRIPAALCGLVGLRPRQARVPSQGVAPLAPSFDSVGVLAPTCAAASAVFAAIASPSPAPGRGEAGRAPILLLPSQFRRDLDAPTSAAFAEAVSTLRRSGWTIEETEIPLFDEAAAFLREGNIVAAEAHAFHAPNLDRLAGLYEPITLARIRRGGEITRSHYDGLMRQRNAMAARAMADLGRFDALIFPTCPTIAPERAAVTDEASFLSVNRTLLRHTGHANLFDFPAITLPCPGGKSWPVGLSLMSASLSEEDLLALAGRAETILLEQGSSR